MPFKKTVAVLASAFAIWLGFHLSQTPPPRAPSAQPESHPELVAPREPAPVATRAAPPIRTLPPPPTADQQQRYAKKPDGNVIEFQVVDGLAIAYGDVILGKPESGTPIQRGAYDAPTPQTWDHGEVPFAISPELPNPTRVEFAVDYLRQRTGIKLVPYNGQKDAVVFEPGSEHCFSALGKVGGLQPIKLAANCGSQEILHELMHALGFVHEQSRPDRDHYVEILWPNIDEKYQNQFAIVPETFVESEKGSNFDYHSIMLYRPDTFALKPDQPAMRPTGADPISPVTSGLSDEDIRRVKTLYGLPD